MADSTHGARAHGLMERPTRDSDTSPTDQADIRKFARASPQSVFLCDFSHHQLSHRDAVEAAVMRLQLLALSEQRELSCAALQRAIEGMQRVASWHVSDVEKG